MLWLKTKKPPPETGGGLSLEVGLRNVCWTTTQKPACVVFPPEIDVVIGPKAVDYAAIVSDGFNIYVVGLLLVMSAPVTLRLAVT